MNGTSGSTTFTDSSASAHTMTADGNAQISTAQSKFGGASGLFDGSGDGIHTADSSDWHFGTGDFTIDFWNRFISKGAGGDSYWYVQNGVGDHFIFKYDDSVPGIKARWNATFVINQSWTANLNQWYHIELSRSGTSVRLFVDGTQLGSTATDSFNINYSDSLYIGMAENASGSLNGYLDEYRVSKGVARHVANFTPPTVEYS